MLNIEKLYELMRDWDIESLAELSRRTKVPYTTLNYMINGHDMHVSTALQLSNYFKLPVDTLIRRNNKIATYSDRGVRFTDTANIYEATMSTMM